MLPWFAALAHTNYTRWGSVYLYEMQQLKTTAPEIYNEFMRRNFVLRIKKGDFNQMPIDQGLEHVNRICKMVGGIIGITKTDSALNRWAIAFNVPMLLVDKLRNLLGIMCDPSNFDDHSAQKQQRQDVDAVIEELIKHNVFNQKSALITIPTTGEMASKTITDSMLSLHENGKDIVKNIAQVRLITSGGNSLYDTVSAPKLMTLNDIGKFQDEKTKSRKRTKLETDVYRASHESYASGRDVNIAELAGSGTLAFSSVTYRW